MKMVEMNMIHNMYISTLLDFLINACFKILKKNTVMLFFLKNLLCLNVHLEECYMFFKEY